MNLGVSTNHTFMKLDDRNLSVIYDDINYKDYLTIDESELDNYNWDSFFNHSNCGIFGVILLEEFGKLQSMVTRLGTEDIYEVTLRNMQKFKLILNFWNPINTDKAIEQKIAMVKPEMRKEDPEIHSKYVDFKAGLNPGEYMCLIQFKDDDGNHNITGNVGASAHELFVTLQNAILDSFGPHYKSGNLAGIVMRVDKREPRRLTLYRKLIEKYMNDRFPNIFIDDKTENDQNMLFLIATR